MLAYEQIAERKIRKAICNGELDNLKDHGKPVDLNENYLIPASLRMAFRILKNAGVSPQQVQVLKEINTLKQKIKDNEDKNYKLLLLNQLAILETQKSLPFK